MKIYFLFLKLWMELFAGTVPENNTLFAGNVPENNTLLLMQTYRCVWHASTHGRTPARRGMASQYLWTFEMC